MSFQESLRNTFSRILYLASIFDPVSKLSYEELFGLLWNHMEEQLASQILTSITGSGEQKHRL